MYRTLLSLIALVLVSLLVSCERPAPPSPNAPPGAESARWDGDPASVRLVALSPAVALILQDLGLEDRIVGTHDFDTALSASIPRVGSFDGIDYEALLLARPTHVLIELNKDKPLPARLESLSKERGWIVQRFGSIDTLDDIARVMDDLYLTYVSPPEDGEANAIGFSDPADRFDKAMPSEAFARSIADRGPIVGGAGRILLLGAVSPPGALGPGSFHAQVLGRIGGENALESGGLWQELDAEDVVRLSPDGIVIVMPRDPTDDDRFVEPRRVSASKLIERLGAVGRLDIPAIKNRRVALIDSEHCQIPAGSSMSSFANDLAGILEQWTAQRSADAP